jgi:ribosome-associated protein
MIRINDHLSIPDDELFFTFSRSPGPGGQNVNKLATKATLRFDVAVSPSLTDWQRRRLREELASRLDKHGVLAINSSRERTQSGNQRDALSRFIRLVADALRPRAVRKKTRPTKASKERRLTEKAARKARKQFRTKRFSRDE